MARRNVPKTLDDRPLRAWMNDIANDVEDSVSPLTTKGDVYGFSTAGARIPVGANGTVLTANSAAALGVSWTAAASSSPIIFAATADQTVGNSIVETTLFAAGAGSLTLAANALTVGKSVRVMMMGNFGTANGVTQRYRLKLGATTVADTGAVTHSGAYNTPKYWGLLAILTCRATGVGGSVMANIDAKTISAAGAQPINVFATLPAAAVAIDTTIAQAIDLTLLWGTAAAGNTVTVNNALVESL